MPIADPALQAARDRLSKSLAEEGKSPDEVAGICIEAIRENRLYVFTHPDWNGVITARAARIVEGKPGPLPMA